MGIFDFIDENKNKKEYLNGMERAQKIFDKNSESLKNIRNTEGFKTILEYLTSIRKQTEQRLCNTKGNDLQELQIRYKLITELLDFIGGNVH